MRLVRVIDRYVFVEALGQFILGFGGFLGFLVVNKLFLEAERILNPQFPGMAIVLESLLDTPYFATLALPVATMFATLMSMGRLAKDNELTAMFTNGVSLYRLFLPYLLLSSMAVGASYYTNEYLLTWAAEQKQVLYNKHPVILENKERGEPDPFIVKLDNDQFISAKLFDKNSGVLTDVVYDNWNNGGERLVIARNAQTEGESIIMGQNMGSPAILYTKPEDPIELQAPMDEFDIDEDEPSGPDSELLYESFIAEPRESIFLGLDLKQQFTEMKTPQELTQTELAQQVKHKEELGENTAEEQTDFHLRFSGPFASMAFALVAMPLSLKAPRDERLLGLILTFVLVLVYYTVFFIGKLMGYNEVIPPILAAWLQNILFAMISLFIFIFSRK